MVEHSSSDSVLPAADSPIAVRRRSWREFKDRTARYGVAVGGVSVIFAIVLIFFYLLYVVLPLFNGADIETETNYQVGVTTPVHTALNEYKDVGFFADNKANLHFFNVADGEAMSSPVLPLPNDVEITSFAKGDLTTGVMAYGLANGEAIIFKREYKITYPDDKRLITPKITYPIGESLVKVSQQGEPLSMLAVQSNEEQSTVVGLTDSNKLVLLALVREESFMDEDEFTIEESRSEIQLPDVEVITHLRVDIDQRELYLADDDGFLLYYDISDVTQPHLIQKIKAVPSDVDITALEFLTGGISILVGRSDGQIDQWFPLRDSENNYTLHNVRFFSDQSDEIIAIEPEYARKGFLALDTRGNIGIYHTTAERTLLVEPMVKASEGTLLGISPRADGLLTLSADGGIDVIEIDNEHPEVSWHSIWEKVWYESRDKPEYIWQSSSASNDFEPKFSLSPLTFGTLKAAFYAMLVAIPLAIMGAIYTAYFMSPKMRTLVKPTIEIMEALPTVILGFLAGLWLAPIVEGNLPGVFTILIVMPIATILTAYLWTKLPKSFIERIPDGWEAAILVPIVIVVGMLSMLASPTLELWLFDGDMPRWLDEVGIGFDQRNSLVVGFAMGFAVIPTIFSITEDAIFGVPKHLTIGSLALGATPWQTLTRVVLLTASPGIFSAVMIGLGRAVGETMIVLMATGNTPIMDFNIFEGFRALSANIAVEMPEAEVASTHYRILFLAALVLFMATFVFNTIAEVVRQRLRTKYSSL